MAKPIAHVSDFFKDHFTFCLSVFDSKRGQAEGEEYEKVLGFYPTTAALTVRTAIVGLAQALTSFTGTFTKEEPDFRTMDAANNRWLFLSCEPHIWMLMVVSKSWLGPMVSVPALQSFMRNALATMTLLHTPVSNLLEQDPDGYAARRSVQAFLDEIGSGLNNPSSRDLKMLTNPLASTTSLPSTFMAHKTFLGVQCLAHQLMLCSSTGPATVRGVMMSWRGTLLWSTLGEGDTLALMGLAGRVLHPVARAVTQPSKLGPAPTARDLLTGTPLSPAQWAVPANASSSGFLMPRRPARASGGSSGSLGSFASSNDVQGLSMARVWLQATSEYLPLLPYFYNHLLVLTLLSDSAQAGTAGAIASSTSAQPPPPPPLPMTLPSTSDIVTTAVTPLLLEHCPGLVTALIDDERTVGGRNMWHERGFRYVYEDLACGASRATPPSKIRTLTPHTLATVADLRSKICSISPSLDDQGSEVCARTVGDTWILLHSEGHRRLVAVLEGSGESSLEVAASRLQTLAGSVSPGVFHVSP